MSNVASISVVIPCFNGAAYLHEALESVLAQSRPVREAIVVDDGSTDESASLARAFGDPVRVISQENQGESVARNRGIDEAQGEWIALLDADDRWEPTKLERQLAVASPDVIAVHTDVYSFGALNGRHIGPDVSDDVLYSLEYIADRSPLHPSSLLVRRSVCPRFRPEIRYGEDLIFQFDLVRAGRIARVPEMLTGYRRHGECQSRKTEDIHLRWYETIDRWLRENERHLPAITVVRIRDDAIRRLLRAAQSAKWNRRWKQYRMICDFVRSNCRGNSAASALVARAVLPPACYAVKDLVVSIGAMAIRRFRPSEPPKAVGSGFASPQEANGCLNPPAGNPKLESAQR